MLRAERDVRHARLPHVRRSPTLIAWLLAAALDTAHGAATSAPPAVHFTGEQTDGKAIRLPDDLHGKPVILVVSFTQEAGKRTDAWGDALQQHLGSRAAIVGVAVLDRVPGFLRGMIKRAIAKDVGPPEVGKPGFVTTTDAAALRAAAPPGNADDPVIYVLRSGGELTAVKRAAFSDAAEHDIELALP